MTRTQFLVKNSLLNAIRSVSSCFESDLIEHELSQEELDAIALEVAKNVSGWQTENCIVLLEKVLSLKLG